MITVRHNPKKVAITGAKTTLYDLYITTDTTYESLHGNLKKNRIVHLQYLGVSEAAVTSELWWLTQPLLSKDVEESIDTVRAPLDPGISIDRWSYDESQFLRLKQTATQNYYIKIIEYEVVEYPGKPDGDFLHIFANGQAQFVRAGSPISAIGAYERRALRELEELRKTRPRG